MFYTTLEIKSELSEMSVVESFIDNLIQDFFIDPDYQGIVSVPLIEAVLNAIIHGNNENESKKVLITCQFSKKQLEFSVSDQGKGFDYETVFSSELTNKNGLTAMKLLCDEISFLNNGSTVSFTVTIPTKVGTEKALKAEEAKKNLSKEFLKR